MEPADDHRLRTHPHPLHRDHEPVSGHHGFAKPNIFHTAEADHARLQQIVLLRVVTRQLGGRFTHHHARHHRHHGKMTPHPKLVVGDVLITDAQATRMIFVNDRRELLHLEPLLVPTADLLDVGDDMRQIVFAGMDDVVARGHGERSLRLAMGRPEWVRS